jgi:PAS domain S-box-containing protein
MNMVAPESRSAVAESIREGREETYEHRLLRKDGSSFIVEARAKMVRAGNRTVRMTALRDITGRKKGEQALRESEEKFSRAFRNSPNVMSITDLETGRYIEVNDAHEKIFGYKREEVIGRSAVELGIIQDSPFRDELLRALRETGRIMNREIQSRTRDGRPLILLHSAEVIELGGKKCVLRVSHDVTDRKCAEEALRESEQRFRSYFELAAVGFSISSRETRLLAVNDEYCRIMGYSREELLAKTWVEMTHPEDLKPNEILFDQALAGKTDAYTLNKRMIRKDGQVIHTTVSVRCVRRPDGVPDYFVGLLLDITEREKAVEREQQARAEYTLRLIASQEAERERIAGQLHDSLGQCLSLIKNHVQLILLQKRIPAAARKELETISETTSAAIAEMRRISQDLHPYQLDHLGLTGALTALLESAANASHIVFEKKLDGVEGVFSRDAAANLYRIVQEAVNNILKHSGAKHSRITLERDVRDVRLFIEDDGQGFSPNGQAKGMGLKNMAERARILGGSLKLDSAPGNGVRIEIIVPISAERE